MTSNPPANPPRLRWFRFSLRTLFVFVTVFCVWLSSQLHIVRERQRAKVWVSNHEGRYFDEAHAIRVRRLEKIFGWAPIELEIDQMAPLPVVRRCLGDRVTASIVMPENATPDEYARMRKLFPEAEVKGPPTQEEREFLEQVRASTLRRLEQLK